MVHAHLKCTLKLNIIVFTVKSVRSLCDKDLNLTLFCYARNSYTMCRIMPFMVGTVLPGMQSSLRLILLHKISTFNKRKYKKLQS